MPFEISIKIYDPLGRAREIVRVSGRNCGPPDGDHENIERSYWYSAENFEDSVVIEGEVLHVCEEGMEKLASIILHDLTSKP